MGKCYYCNNETNNTIKINGYDGFEKSEQIVFCCSENHEKEINEYINYSNRYGKRFTILICLLSILVCGAIPLAFYIKHLFLSLIVTFLPFILMGQLIYIYPFATPQSTKKIGVKNSVIKTKKLGRLMQIISLILAIILFISIKLFM